MAAPIPSLPGGPVYDRAVSSAGQTFLEIAVAVAVVAVLVVSWRIQRRWGTSMGFVAMAGTFLASGVEVVYNSASNFWYYRPGADALFTTWDRSLPTWALVSYTPFYAGLGILGWYLLERGVSRRQMVFYALGVWVFAIVTESSLISLHVYQYYGDQPFRLGNFPAWISSANAMICVAVAVGCARLARVLTGWRQLLGIALGPAVISVGLIGSTFPGVLALHADRPTTAAVYIGAVLADLLGVLLIAATLQLVPRDGLADSLLPARRERPQARVLEFASSGAGSDGGPA